MRFEWSTIHATDYLKHGTSVQQIHPGRNRPCSGQLRPRTALRKLRAAAGPASTADAAATAQEMLDFLAMVDGMKPVYVLGRGLIDAAWQAGVAGVAADLGLRVVEGPYWDVPGGMAGLPAWYVDHTAAELAPFTARYICRTRAVADEVAAICRAGGRTSVEQEARLLDYPACCVAAHYGRNAAFHRASLAVLHRAAGGEEEEMRRLLAEGAALRPESDAEQAALEACMTVTPCPYTSFNMCLPCCADADRPAAQTSLRYARLAHAVDPALAGQIAET